MSFVVVASVICVAFPVFQIDMGVAAEKPVELFYGELIHFAFRNEFVEASFESRELAGDDFLGHVFDFDYCVFHFVVISDFYLLPVLCEFMGGAVGVVVDEVLFDELVFVDGVFVDVFKGVVMNGVEALQIL